MDQIRVLIADDHPAARKGIRMFLTTEPYIHVVGEAENCQDTVEKAARLRPDVILLDLLMPKGCGIEAIAELKSCLPDVKIIVLTIVTEEQVIDLAMKAGADAYLSKDLNVDSLLQAIQAVARPDTPVDPCLGQHRPRDTVPFEDTKGTGLLTCREKEVLQLMSWGLSNRELAHTLGVSKNTVKTHVKHILKRLDVSSRTEAVVLAARLGLISRDPEKSENMPWIKGPTSGTQPGMDLAVD